MSGATAGSADVDDGFDPFAAGAVERVVATSAAQREVWLADRLGREASLAFNESVTLAFAGPLDAAALQRALDGVVARHAVLRATVAPDASRMPIGAAQPLPCPVEDLSGHSPAEIAQALCNATTRAVETPFDLERGPLIRARLLRLDANEHRLLLTAHHIVCDGWSWGVIVSDLASLYTAALGRAAPLLPPADDWGDYVRWADDQASGATGDAHARYWLSRFPPGSLPVLELPTDRPRTLHRGFRSRRVDHVLPATLVADVQRVGGEQGCSVFSTLFAAFAATLQRLTGQGDFVVGVPVAGQPASGFTSLVGHCVNLLPVRTDPRADEPFEAYLLRASGTLLDAFDHAAHTYGSLLALLTVARDPSRLPLVSVMFNVDPAVGRVEGFLNLHTTLQANPRRFENFELFVSGVRLPDGGLRLECQYGADLFDGATVARWLRCYEALLGGVARDASAPVGTLSLVEGDDGAALADLRGSLGPESVAGLMHGAFLERARRDPARVAVRDAGQQWTYGELDARSNRLARALRERGAGRGDRVGICLPRDADLLTALLAVLKAGAAYVPLDPDFPPARLAYYAQDAGLAWLVTDTSVAHAPSAWRADAAQRIVRLDADAAWRDGSGAPLPPAGGDARPDDPAYVIYTSGSTGLPKGVVVPHRAVASFLAAMTSSPGLAADDRLAAVTTLSFDIAVLELLLPLSVGAEVAIVPRATAADGGLLREHLARVGATALQATPGLWRMLVDAGWRGGETFKALVGGEPLPLALAHDLLVRAGAVWNLYGPTETTIWSTAWRVDAATLGERGVAIGRPIAGTTVRVVDERGVECPIGVPGEIRIGGRGVASGYLSRPALTAERFVADPLSDHPAARCYRTGDRGRWRNDGVLEHLGRDDFQVKVRGYRIEPGEIEAVCDEASGVSRSIVVAREDEPGDVRLVAYLEVAPGAAVDLDALRARLRERLPDHMQPQHVVRLDALPLLPNAKVDRGALPPPTAVADARNGGIARSVPRNDRERHVLAAFEATLKLPDLGIDDDFFALGGHSLLAARLVNRLTQAFALAIPLRLVFEAPTPARLAGAIDRIAASGSAQAVVVPAREPVRHDPALRSAPLTAMQARIRFIEELHPGRAMHHLPWAWRIEGSMDLTAFRRAFAAVVAGQPALRTQIAVRDDGEPEQRLVDTVASELALVDLSHLEPAMRDAQLAASIADVAVRPIDTRAAPLFHAVLYRLAAGTHVFQFVPHHLVWDGASFGLLHDELAARYAVGTGRSDDVPPAATPTPFDHAHWHRRWLQGDEAKAQLGRWKTRFSAVVAPTPLRTDRPRAGGGIGRGGWQPIAVDRDLAARVRAAANRLGVTTGMLAMLVFASLVATAARSRSVVLGMPVRGRAGDELDRTMGFFNNVLPIPIDVDSASTLATAAAALRAETLDALANQDVPFECIAAEPEVQRAASASGIYQAMFAFQEAGADAGSWGALRVEPILIAQRDVTEELGVWLLEQAGAIRGGLSFDADRFEPSTVAALAAAFVDGIGAVAGADPAVATLADLTPPVGGGDPTTPTARPGAEDPADPADRPLRALSDDEAALAGIWAELLAVDPGQIRAGDNFFDLGGDSLLAMRAVKAGVRAFGARVDARRYIYESLAQVAIASRGRPAAVVGEAPAIGWFGRFQSALARRYRR